MAYELWPRGKEQFSGHLVLLLPLFVLHIQSGFLARFERKTRPQDPRAPRQSGKRPRICVGAVGVKFTNQNSTCFAELVIMRVKAVVSDLSPALLALVSLCCSFQPETSPRNVRPIISGVKAQPVCNHSKLRRYLLLPINDGIHQAVRVSARESSSTQF